MVEGKFATSVSCIDGRIQIPLAKWIKENYSVDYVDTITEPGVDKTITENSVFESFLTLLHPTKFKIKKRNNAFFITNL